MLVSDIKFIVIHCSATRPDQNIDISDIDEWHRAKGWNGCGYHFVIKRDGTVQGGRSLTETGAHAYGYNRVSWGICLVGGLDESGEPMENSFTEKQLTAARALISGLHNMAPDAEVLGHRDLSPDVDGDGVIEPWEWVKQCPCMDTKTWYRNGGRA